MTDSAGLSAAEQMTPHHPDGCGAPWAHPAPAPFAPSAARPGATTGGGSAARATAACVSDPVQGFEKIDFDAALTRRVERLATAPRLRLLRLMAEMGGDGWTDEPFAVLLRRMRVTHTGRVVAERHTMEAYGWIESRPLPGRWAGRPPVSLRMTPLGRAVRAYMAERLFGDIAEVAP